jgi:myosin-5
MIEGRLGILDLLDEESRLPSGADGSYISKLYQNFGKDKFFAKPRFGQTAFTVKHYACDVTYEIEGFIDKNKDTVADEQLQVLQESSLPFVVEITKVEEKSKTPPSSSKSSWRSSMVKKPTLGSIFKESLISLMDTIHQTEVHYIRCIKPNEAKVAFQFEAPMVLGQLRACGVLETIRISNAGYPSRYVFSDFAARYYLLVHSKKWKGDRKALTMKIVEETIKEEDKYQVGKTKIFFRAGQVTFFG